MMRVAPLAFVRLLVSIVAVVAVIIDGRLDEKDRMIKRTIVSQVSKRRAK
jgi:hypothetical protein